MIFNLDPDLDPNRNNPDVHYRLYLHPTRGLTVICVQNFDYPDYDATRLVSYQAWDTEHGATYAIVALYDELQELERGMTRWVES